MSRFDPTPDALYARCADCEMKLPDEAAVREHLTATRTEQRGRSHSVHLLNPSRSQRIEMELDDLVHDALQEFVEGVWGLVDKGVTEEEISEAMRSLAAGDFADAWRER